MKTAQKGWTPLPPSLGSPAIIYDPQNNVIFAETKQIEQNPTKRARGRSVFCGSGCLAQKMEDRREPNLRHPVEKLATPSKLFVGGVVPAPGSEKQTKEKYIKQKQAHSNL